ncbi:MAG: hypothetical protein ACU0DI_01175 [Paracoccaceae bacterium]
MPSKTVVLIAALAVSNRLGSTGRIVGTGIFTLLRERGLGLRLGQPACYSR